MGEGGGQVGKGEGEVMVVVMVKMGSRVDLFGGCRRVASDFGECIVPYGTGKDMVRQI